MCVFFEFSPMCVFLDFSPLCGFKVELKVSVTMTADDYEARPVVIDGILVGSADGASSFA